MRRRFKDEGPAVEHDNASDEDPTPTTIVPAQNGRSTNGHGAPTLVEHVGDDIVVWPAPDEDAWASNGSSAASAVPLTAESADADETDEWLGVGAGSRFVNLHFILGAVRRRRRWVIGAAIAGLVVGLLLSVASAPTPQAETKVLLTFPASSDRTLAMATDTQLLETDAVARRVVNALHLHESPAAFAASYKGTGLSDDLLGISVSAPSSAEALRRVRTCSAHEYLAYRADVYQHQSNAIVEGLQKRQEAIQSQIDELTRQLGPQADSLTSTDPAIATLLAQRNGLSNRFNTLNDSIAAQTNSSTAVVDGSFVIDKATPVEASKVKELGRNALSGLAAGLGIGLALVVLLAVTSNRVWRRADVAEAMRHSVNLSTGPIRVRRRMAKVAMRKLIARPTPELAKVVLHLRRQLAASGWRDRSLAVIAVGGLEVAAASVCATATALARDGGDVVVVDTSERSIVSRGRLLRDTESETTGGDGRGRIRLASLGDGREAPSIDPDEVVLVLAMLDPAEGAEQIRALVSTAVAIVTAGRSTMTSLGAVSDMLEVAAGRTRLRRPRRLECSRRIIRSTRGRSGERTVAQPRVGHVVGVRRGPVSTAAFSQNVDAVKVERGVWRHGGFIWGLLIVNGLAFSAVPTLVPLPSGVVKVVTQSALAVAFVWVLLLNRDRLVRPNLCLGLFSILALSSLVTSVRLNTGIGSLARDVRFVMFLAVLWLLTPLWGRRDMLLARWHVRCLAVVCGTVVLGLVTSPGGAFVDGRLYNRIWPTPSPQVAHYAAVLTGMVIVAWLSGMIKTRPAARDGKRRLRDIGAHPHTHRNDRARRRRDRRDAQSRRRSSPRPARLGRVARRGRTRRGAVRRAAFHLVRPRPIVRGAVRPDGPREGLGPDSGRASAGSRAVARFGAVGQILSGPADRQLLVVRLPGSRPRR